MVRQATNRLLEMIDEGMLDCNFVLQACLLYMSEDEVADMCHINEFFEEEVEDLLDDFNRVGSRHHY